MNILEPRARETDPHYAIKTQFHLEAGFEDLVRQAVEGGWNKDDVRTALIDLAHNYRTDLIEDRRTLADTEAVERKASVDHEWGPTGDYSGRHL